MLYFDIQVTQSTVKAIQALYITTLLKLKLSITL